MPHDVETYAEGATSLFAAFCLAADARPENTALRGDGGRGQEYSYREVKQAVRRLAAGLQTGPCASIGEIGLLSENRPEWPISYLAIVAAGKTVVPLDANLKPAELTDLIAGAGLRVVIASGRFAEFLNGLPDPPQVYSFDEGAGRNWQNLTGNPSDWSERADRDTLAALIYTSGTTGKPKAVMLTHGNLLANLVAINRALRFGSYDIWLSLLPLHHTFEATCGFLTPLTCGAAIVYARSLKSREILEDIGYVGATVMCGVPLLYEKMFQSMNRKIQAVSAVKRGLVAVLTALSAVGWKFGFKWGRVLFRSLRSGVGLATIRIMVSGGAALPPVIARQFNLMGIHLFQGYGMTEASPVIAVNKPGDVRFGSVGPPLDGVEVRINEPGPSGIGEIVVRGANVTPGYKNNPGATAEILSPDGWLHTGDLGRLAEGHLWITGRAKNLIVSAAGKNIYPEELEERLVVSGYILEALVFGRSKIDRQGEEVRALLVPDPDQFRSEFGWVPDDTHREQVTRILKDVVTGVNTQVADYKRIADFDVQYEELQKTSTRKVKRFLYK
ncbi:MAG: AMP-binding protein [candidate division Zixibacteria bacterium]|nr:AMP-binding protein [candidate division Zixibacteria bacterium]